MRTFRSPNTFYLFLMTLVLVVGFGFLSCRGAMWFFGAVNEGFLAKWISLGTPPGGAVSIQITANEWPAGKAIVKTADGNFFAYRPGLSAQWEEYTYITQERVSLNPKCPGANKPLPSPPHEIIDCSGFASWEWQNTQDFYAVLDDGSVWRWQSGMGLMEELIIAIGVTLFGAAFGFLLSRVIARMGINKD